MMAWLDTLSLWLAATFVSVSIDVLVLAVPVWLLCRFVSAVPAAVRTWLWWGVSLKMLLGVLGAPGLQVAAWPQHWAPLWQTASPSSAVAPAAIHATRVDTTGPRGSAAATGPAIAIPGTASVAVRPAAAGTSPGATKTDTGATWQTLVLRGLALVWLGGVAIHLRRLWSDAVALGRVRRRAMPVPLELASEHRTLARRLGLAHVPPLCASPDVTVPQVVGLVRPTVLVPADALSSLSAGERAMVLCHELMHVRRHDLSLAWVPALASRVFVWHPVGSLAAREYALAREAACDRDVVQTLETDARDYGRLLVRLGVGPAAAGVAAAGASPNLWLLRRRLHMLKEASSRAARPWLAAPAFALVLLPLQFVPLDTLATSGPASGVRSNPASGIDARPIAGAQSSRSSTSRGSDDTWIYLHSGNDSVTMHGDSKDIERARAHRRSSADPLFYFTRDGQEYIIDDKATLKAVARIFEPQMELGRQQGELGTQQGRLGERQGALGEQQASLGARQGELGARQGAFAVKIAAANADVLTVAAERMRRGEAVNTEEVRRREAEAKARISELDREMSELSAQQTALGGEQSALGDKQSLLGIEQNKLGEQQARLGELQRQAAEKADRELGDLIDKAIANHIARKVAGATLKRW